MTLDAANLQAIGAIGGLILAQTTLIVTLLGGWMFWLIRDHRRETDRNIQDLRREMDNNIQTLRREMDNNTETLRREMDNNTETLRREMDNNRRDMDSNLQDIRREMERNRQEMTRNHREVMALLGSHTHGTDDARPVFHDLPEAADEG